MMTENDLPARAAVCGAGIMLAVICFIAHLPLILLAVPVIIFFLGIVPIWKSCMQPGTGY